MEQLTLFAEEAPAVHSVSPDSGRLWTIHAQLMLEYLRACHEIDPEWIVWENVPGVLSADGGRAFGSLLAGVLNSYLMGGRHGECWTLNSTEYQRRRRVFLVINTRDWRRSAPVLFERESLRWDYPSSQEKRQALADGLAGVTGAAAQSAVAIAGNIIGRRDGNGGNGYGYERDGAMYTLTATDVHGVWCAGDSGTNMPYYHDMAPTLTAHDANLRVSSMPQVLALSARGRKAVGRVLWCSVT